MTTQSDEHHLDTARLPFIDAKRSGRAGPSGRQARNLPNARYSHHSSPRARHELKFVLGASASVRTTWQCHWAAPPAPHAPAAGDRRRAYIRLQKACTPPRRENHKGPAASPIGRDRAGTRKPCFPHIVYDHAKRCSALGYGAVAFYRRKTVRARRAFRAAGTQLARRAV